MAPNTSGKNGISARNARLSAAASIAAALLAAAPAHGQDTAPQPPKVLESTSLSIQPIDLPTTSPSPTPTIKPAVIKPEPPPPTIATDRPGFGDTTNIAPVGHLILELGYTYTFRDRRGVETQTHNGPEVLARVGLIDDRLEFRASTSGYVWTRSNDGTGGGFSDAHGFSDVSLGFKLKVLDQNGLVPRLALEAITTIGIGSSAISNRDAEPTLKLIGSWDLGSNFSLTSNAGITYATSGGQRFVQGLGSVSIGYAASDTVSLFCEYFVVGPHGKGTDAAHSIDFGGAYLLNRCVQIDARLGFGLNQEADNMFAGAGLSFLF